MDPIVNAGWCKREARTKLLSIIYVTIWSNDCYILCQEKFGNKFCPKSRKITNIMSFPNLNQHWRRISDWMPPLPSSCDWWRLNDFSSQSTYVGLVAVLAPWSSFWSRQFAGNHSSRHWVNQISEWDPYMPYMLSKVWCPTTWTSVRLHFSLANSRSFGRQSKGEVVPQVLSITLEKVLMWRAIATIPVPVNKEGTLGQEIGSHGWVGGCWDDFTPIYRQA